MKAFALFAVGLPFMTALSASALPVTNAAEPPGVARPLKVLTIGNSFSIAMNSHLPPVVKSFGRKIDICSMYIGGCSIERHVKNSRSGEGAYHVIWNYADGKAPFMRDGKPLPMGDGGKLTYFISADHWDVVTIQQASHDSWRPESYTPWGDELVAFIRKNAPQAKIVVQETWSYTPWDPRLAKWGIDQMQMYDKLHAVYRDFAYPRGFEVIPTGTAVQLYRKALPVTYTENSFGGDPCGSATFVKDEKTGKWTPKGDVFHMNGKGHHLQALTWAEVLFGVDARQCTYQPKGLDAVKLREAAHAAVLAERADFKKFQKGDSKWCAKQSLAELVE